MAAICDISPERLKDVGDEYNIGARYTSFDEMLEKEKPDVVSIATPNDTHKPLSIKAMAAGCHVLCEKPLAMNTPEAKEILAASKKYNRRLMINFSTRISAEAYAMKRAVDSGVLGDVYFARSVWTRRRRLPGFGGWFGIKQRSGGGPLIDIGVHRLDLALWLMGYPKPVWVMGSTYDKIATEIAAREGKKFDVEDIAVAMIKFENGATLELEASWCANQKDREHLLTRLMGTKGGLLHRNTGDTYDSYAELYVEQDSCQYDMRLHPPVPDVHVNMYNFVDAILNNKPHDCTPEQGIEVMQILDAVYESAAKGIPIKIKD